MQQSRVGSKGELFPSKEIREKLKLNAHAKVIYRIEAGRLIVEPILSLKDVFEENSCIEITFEEQCKLRKELSSRAEI
jgi:hypothetical protein